MTDVRCWRCRNEEQPRDREGRVWRGCDRLALCERHLREQVRLTMGLPATPPFIETATEQD